MCTGVCVNRGQEYVHWSVCVCMEWVYACKQGRRSAYMCTGERRRIWEEKERTCFPLEFCMLGLTIHFLRSEKEHKIFQNQGKPWQKTKLRTRRQFVQIHQLPW